MGINGQPLWHHMHYEAVWITWLLKISLTWHCDSHEIWSTDRQQRESWLYNQNNHYIIQWAFLSHKIGSINMSHTHRESTSIGLIRYFGFMFRTINSNFMESCILSLARMSIKISRISGWIMKLFNGNSVYFDFLQLLVTFNFKRIYF